MEPSIQDQLVSINARLSSVANKVHSLELGARSTASKLPLGSPFQGIAFCDRSVELAVQGSFQCDGKFTESWSDRYVFVLSDREIVPRVKIVWPIDDNGDKPVLGPVKPLVLTPMQMRSLVVAKAWDVCILAALGPVKHNEAAAAVKDWYATPKFQEEPTCDEVGLDSKHSGVDAALREIMLRNRFPRVMAIGDMGVAVSASRLQDVIAVFDDVTRALDCGLCSTLEIHVIEPQWTDLAMAILRGHGGSHEWSRLTERDRVPLLHGTHKYFTLARLASFRMESSYDD